MAGLKGGSGKTIVSLSLCRAWCEQKFKVKPFKKGPDYIDAKWLSLAAGREASNLDPFLFPSKRVLELFWNYAAENDVAVVEGNRGLFDGMDVEGTFSTAELARLLNAPVVLVLDCTKVTRTMAAIVQGCKHFEPDVQICGVILNQTAGERHRSILRRSILEYTDLPVLGELPKIRENPIPERHMGLISDQEYSGAEKMLAHLSHVGNDYLDTQGLMDVAGTAESTHTRPLVLREISPCTSQEVVIGCVQDAALWFYYQENISALRACGAKIVQLSLLLKKPWPEIHGLYLGGGFPETLGPGLSENHGVKTVLAELVRQGLPVYAECGGFMYLGESLSYAGQTFPMTGIMPVHTRVSKKPQGHGYVRGDIIAENPFFPRGYTVHGHEFHYSSCDLGESTGNRFALALSRGTGISEGRDALVQRNALGAYTHIHALGHLKWAENFVRAAEMFKNYRSDGLTCPDLSGQ